MGAEQVVTVVEPFVRRGLFPTPEQAVMEMARDYILHQIKRYQTAADEMQAKHGMSYEQFEAYLQARSATLMASPSPELNEAVMIEEEDALDWKVAREMLQSWLGLQTEVRG